MLGTALGIKAEGENEWLTIIQNGCKEWIDANSS